MNKPRQKYIWISPKIRYSFLFLDLFYLATGLILLIVGVLWWEDLGNSLRNVIVTPNLLAGSIFVGGLVTFSFLLSAVGLFDPLRRKNFLIAYCVIVVCVIISLLCLGGVVWFSTLSERAHFGGEWTNNWSDSMKGLFQDELKCCGWQNVTTGFIPSSFCPTIEESMNKPGCLDPLVVHADDLLRNLFTTMFGFITADVFAFFACVILIQARNVEERYRKIDEKNGGGGDRALKYQFV